MNAPPFPAPPPPQSNNFHARWPQYLPDRLLRRNEVALAVLPPGHFLTEYITYAQMRTDAPVEYHSAIGLVCLSCAVGRGLSVPLITKPKGLHANIWVQLVGNSTLLRKSTSMNLGIELLKELDPEMFIANESTPPGMIQEMASRSGKPAIWHRDEFSGFYRQMGQDFNAGFKQVLIKLYDGDDHYRRLRAKTSNGQRTPDEDIVKDPYFVILSGTVEDQLLELASTDDVLEGFLPRFIFVLPTSIPVRRPVTLSNSAVTQATGPLLRRLQDIRDLYENASVLALPAPPVLDRWNQYCADLELEAQAFDQEKILGPVFARLGETAMKIAVLIEAGKSNVLGGPALNIALESMLFAINLCEEWRHMAVSVLSRLGQRGVERQIQRVLERVTSSPNIKRGELMRNLRLNSTDMDRIQKTLEERGQIQIDKNQGTGKGSTSYRAL